MDNEINNLYTFGEFRFDGETHRLWRDEELILLSPKASELLELLLERGDFVSKQEIFDSVWAGTHVEDGVLTQNIYTLRKALGNDENNCSLIENKTRLGYRIIVPVQKPKKFNVEKIVSTSSIEIKEEQPKDLPVIAPENESDNGKKYFAFFGIAAFLILICLIGYFFLRSQPPPIAHSAIANLQFQKVIDTGDINFPTLSADGNFIAFTKTLDGVYVKDLKTSAVEKLKISNVEKFGFLRFSNDGNFIYLRNRSSFFLPSKIVKVSRFGGAAETVAENVWSGFSFSPDERKIAFVRSFPNENRQSLIVKELKSGAEKEALTLEIPQQFSLPSFPAWSPDGEKIISVVRQQNDEFLKLMIVELNGGKIEDLPIKNFQDVEQAVWLPKKDALLLTARTGKNLQLWEIDLTGKRVERVTNDLNNYQSPVVSADGTQILVRQFDYFSNLWLIDADDEENQKQLTFGTSNHVGFYGIDYFSNGEIVYASNEGESSDVNLWRINPNGGERRQLTLNAGSQNRNPTVSPDDKFVFFSSNRGGKAHIWRVEASGANPSQITFGEDSAEAFPQISPDGAWLYFIRREKYSAAVWRKSLIDNREEPLTAEKQFAPANFLAVSPDGKRLAFQNLTEQIDSENVKQNYQIAVIETENPQTVKSFSVGGGKVEIYWTNDSTAFDYIYIAVGINEVRRISLDENIGEQTLKQFPKEYVFTIARSKDGKMLAVSRGQRKNDAILLTNFE